MNITNPMNRASPQMMEAVRERMRKRHWRTVKSTDSLGAIGIANDAVGVRTKDPRIVSIIITTDDVDLQREVIVPEGVDWAYFEMNKNIFADHQTDIYSGVGALRTLKPIMANIGGIRKMRGWEINGPVHDGELGDHCLKLVKAGCMGASIGFIPRLGGPPSDEETKSFTRRGDLPDYMHREIDGLEATMTLFPCNVPCRVSMADGEAKTYIETGFDGTERLLSLGEVSKKSAAAFGFPTKTGASIRVLSWKKTPPIAVSK